MKTFIKKLDRSYGYRELFGDADWTREIEREFCFVVGFIDNDVPFAYCVTERYQEAKENMKLISHWDPIDCHIRLKTCPTRWPKYWEFLCRTVKNCK